MGCSCGRYCSEKCPDQRPAFARPLPPALSGNRVRAQPEKHVRPSPGSRSRTPAADWPAGIQAAGGRAPSRRGDFAALPDRRNLRHGAFLHIHYSPNVPVCQSTPLYCRSTVRSGTLLAVECGFFAPQVRVIEGQGRVKVKGVFAGTLSPHPCGKDMGFKVKVVRNFLQEVSHTLQELFTPFVLTWCLFLRSRAR